jgi:benzoyl-CoA reductase/2-hydroxyglutaryl-CoA dehydratase subunit BcrC/BadD/HgdB
VNEVKSASTKIKEELARQQKESPEEFKKSVDLMRQKSKDLKDADPLDVASNFVFGMSKSNVQRELIKLQEEVMGTARKTMNLPLDPETKAQLQQTEIGQEYLKILDDFEQSLQQGEAGSKSLKSNLRI